VIAYESNNDFKAKKSYRCLVLKVKAEGQGKEVTLWVLGGIFKLKLEI
jgi:hypothetical protein